MMKHPLVLTLLTSMIFSGCATQPAALVRPAALREQGSKAAATAPAQPIKTIGIIGGVSWVSSAEYYRLMNEMIRDRLGGLHSAQILMFSIEFGEFSKQERLSDRGDWAPLRATLVDAAQRLKRGGADFIVIASNTLNSQADLIEQQVGIPILNIADATAAAVQAKGVRTVALLGTKYTMEQPFYRGRLERRGLKVVTPNLQERDYINTVIFDELCRGQIEPAAKREFLRIIARLAKEEGATGVILGCTEIPLLLQQKDVALPVFDTTAIHTAAAIEMCLGK